MRCSTCCEMGVECPRGYTAAPFRCDVCAYKFVLTAATCMVHIVLCPECGGSIEEVSKEELT